MNYLVSRDVRISPNGGDFESMLLALIVNTWIGTIV